MGIEGQASRGHGAPAVVTRQRIASSTRVLIGLAISALCLVLAFRNVPLDDLGGALAQANYWWLGPALVAQGLSILARTRRWQILLLDRVGFVELLWAQLVGFLGTNIFPLRAGEAARAVVVSRRARIPLVEVSASVLLERVLDVTTVLVLLVCLLPFMQVPAAAAAAGFALGVALGCTMFVLAILLLLGDRVDEVIARCARPLPARVGVMIVARSRDLLAGLDVVRHPRTLGRALVWSALTWAGSVANYWAVIEAVSPGATWFEPTFAVVAIAIGLSVPSSPGFVGVFQFLGQQALVAPFPERYSPASALSIALLTHTLYYVSTSAAGVLGLARLGLSLGALRPNGRGAAARSVGVA